MADKNARVILLYRMVNHKLINRKGAFFQDIGKRNQEETNERKKLQEPTVHQGRGYESWVQVILSRKTF